MDPKQRRKELALHKQRVQKEAKEWWHEGDDLETKKLRRLQNKGQNPNKINKVFVRKGKQKRFYNKPTISWGDLVTKDAASLYNHDDDSKMMDEDIDGDDINVSKYDKFERFDYAEIEHIDDDFEIPSGFNLDTSADIEASDDEEEWEQRDNDDAAGDGPNGMSLDGIEGMDDDGDNAMDGPSGQSEVSGSESKSKRQSSRKWKDEVFDRDGRCTLKLDYENTMFYRHETNAEMLRSWEKMRAHFMVNVRRHSVQLRKQKDVRDHDRINNL